MVTQGWYILCTITFLGRPEGMREKCGYWNQRQRRLCGRDTWQSSGPPVATLCRDNQGNTLPHSLPSMDLLLGLQLDNLTWSQSIRKPVDRVLTGQPPRTQSSAGNGGRWTPGLQEQSPYTHGSLTGSQPHLDSHSFWSSLPHGKRFTGNSKPPIT